MFRLLSRFQFRVVVVLEIYIPWIVSDFTKNCSTSSLILIEYSIFNGTKV